MKEALSQKNKYSNIMWDVCYPVLMYYSTLMIGSFLAEFIFGSGVENYMLCKIVGSLIAIPVVWSFYKTDLMRKGVYGKKPVFNGDVVKNFLWVVAITLLLSVALNNLISMSPLMIVSKEYQNASEAFYGSSIWIELLGSGIITPFLEELLHRGVVYGRLRKCYGFWPSLFLSTLIFGMLHFNVVQFVYAFLLGLVLSLFVEKTGKLYPAVMGHMAANILAVIRTETGILQNTVDGSAFAWGVSVVCLVVGCILLVVYYQGRKQRD